MNDASCTASSAHTPGPWTIEPYTRMDKEIAILEPRAWVDNDDVDPEEAAANARLIAAAPDMLRALQMIADEGHPFHDSNCLCKICIAVRASLSKAEGK